MIIQHWHLEYCRIQSSLQASTKKQLDQLDCPDDRLHPNISACKICSRYIQDIFKIYIIFLPARYQIYSIEEDDKKSWWWWWLMMVANVMMVTMIMMMIIIEYWPMIGCLQVGHLVSFGRQLEQTGWPDKHWKEMTIKWKQTRAQVLQRSARMNWKLC